MAPVHAFAVAGIRSRQGARAVVVLSLASACGVAVTALQKPVLATETLFALTNVAVTVAMVTVGSYMVLYRRERFTGLCYAFAGLSWPLIVLDIYGGWGPYISFIFGAGSTFFVPIVWGCFRYGKPRLTHPAERFYLGYNAFFTSGIGMLFSTFAEPEWLGYSPEASWPAFWPDEQAFAISGAVLLTGFLSASVLFSVLAMRMLREAPPIRRQAIRPLCCFGILLGFGASIAYGSASFTDRLSFHQMTILIGVLALSLTAGLGFAMVRQDVLRGRLLERLPASLQPAEITHYLRDVLGDPTAELSFVDPRTDRLLDADGRLVAPADTDRFTLWITGSDGTCIAVLTGNPLLGNDTSTTDAVRQVLSVLADNARLQVLLRLRVTELTAARTAEKLAFDHAREAFHRDLHDGVQQTLAAARMDLEGLLDSPGASSRPEAEPLGRKLTLALDQVRALRAGGAPPDLEFGLKPAVERTVAGLRLNATCDVTDRPLGIMTLPVYYLVREALTNTHKHSHANHVRVAIDTDGQDIRVEVSDDGIGGARGDGATGIAGMQSRVRELHGTMTVSSPQGAGTSIRARIPHVR